MIELYSRIGGSFGDFHCLCLEVSKPWLEATLTPARRIMRGVNVLKRVG